ncbi:MAG: tRNA (adenosine(37)-N6)-dimethylallyltransferase MiaA [Peptococcia bacterium]
MFPLVVILGPTATGKTKISVELALRLKGEVISGDSMQVYRFMDIGTAKITLAETKGVPHHLLDIKNPDEPFSVADFQKNARAKIAEIAGRGKLPFLVGGTGLYLQSVIDQYEFAEQENVQEYREELLALAEKQGKIYLHQLLAQADPPAAGKIHPNDLKRITRALEYYHLTGQRISDNKEARYSSLYQVVLIGLTMKRELLYQRIEQRVDEMMANGFLEEVKTLLARGFKANLPAMQGLGYKQLVAYLHGAYDLTEAINLIKKETRHFAKRQLTWFKRDPRIQWFNAEEAEYNYEEIISQMMQLIGRTIQH